MSKLSTLSVVGFILLTLTVILLLATTAAEHALPGDVLYPVKKNMNERVRRSLTFSASAESDLEATLAIRRLEEMGALAGDARLSPVMHIKMEREFSSHTISMLSLAEQAAMSGDSEIALKVLSKYRARLDAEESVLVDRASASTGTQLEIDLVIAMLRSTKASVQHADDIIRSRVLGDKEFDTTIQAEALASIDEVAKDIDALNILLETNHTIDAQALLASSSERDDATKAIVLAREQYHRNAYAAAEAYAQQAGHLVQEARTRIESVQSK